MNVVSDDEASPLWMVDVEVARLGRIVRRSLQDEAGLPLGGPSGGCCHILKFKMDSR